MSHVFQVLSIDFDVFANLPDETYLSLYPDGIDVSTELSTIIWADRYANPYTKPDIRHITCNQKELQATIAMIQHGCQPDTPILMVNSHRHIYDWIFQHFDENKYDSIALTHLDMHHDCFNENPNLDCGNWIEHVKNRVPKTMVQWVANPITKSMYGLDTPEFDNVLTTVTDLKPRHFDLVFICRSDPWLPPHLDHDFEAMKNELLFIFDNIRIETCINQPRNIEPFVQQTKELFKQIEKHL